MSNDTDTTEKNSPLSGKGEKTGTGAKEDAKFIPEIAQAAAVGAPGEPAPEGPSTEVVEFQDAAKSMGTLAADAVADQAIYLQQEEAAVIDAPQEPRGGRSQARKGGRYSGGGRRTSARDILVDGVLEKAHRAHPALRAQLRGTVLVKLNGGRERYLIDWRGDSPSAAETGDESADCVISVQEHDLEMIASGSMNPQIAMLSDKISIQGNANFAMYFFNLIAPVAQH